MAVPNFLTTVFRFVEILTSDTQDIINGLYSELVTNGGWTCAAGGLGQSPTTFKSPDRADGLFFAIQCSRVSASRISYVVKDHMGLLVNNDTETRQGIAGTSYVRLYTSPAQVIVDSGGASAGTPECWGCGIMDRTPEPIDKPRPCYWASRGPRTPADALTYNVWNNTWTLKVGGSSYVSGSYDVINERAPSVSQYQDKFTCAGTMFFAPLEFIDGGWLLGRAHGILMAEWSLPDQGVFDVPIDPETLGTFKILGWNISNAAKLCARIA